MWNAGFKPHKNLTRFQRAASQKMWSEDAAYLYHNNKPIHVT